ncbi:lytic transglycosylase domain-containing protein [uncultured Croceicoccus sp.]|uniref:lytic transglycosylase domain-containing protein n=1 Tax=uncultured Croceicoccus sp. TaxID=1295329 RepID=UPI00261BF0F4|nr:lytic transglycosylase domain-containing protein [uncultured Croceicoccus sp.]
MILARGILGLGLALCVPAMPACADVMEVSADGHRWIAGDLMAADDGAAPGLDEEAPAVPGAALANIADHAALLPARYAAKVHELSARFDLSPALIEALVWQESRWREDARSPVGARGLAQLMPGTARDLGVNADDPFANLEGGARYLRQQIDRFDGDIERALAAYNAGPGRVIRAGGVPRIRETQTYVAAVMGRLSDHSRR